MHRIGLALPLLAALAAFATAAVAPAVAESPAAAQAVAGGTLDRIDARGRFLLGHRLGARPFSFSDGEGGAAGYTVDLCRAVIDEVKHRLGRPGLETVHVPVTAENRFDKLAAGEIDLLCGATTSTLSRQGDMAFSSLTFVTGATLLTRTDTGISSVADLGGRRVGVIHDTTTRAALQQALDRAGAIATIAPMLDHAAALSALEEGAIDAYAGDRIVLIGLSQSAADPSRLTLAGGLFSHEPFALAMRPNDDAFRALVNRALSRVYGSTAISDIYERWFGAMGARPSELLRALYVLQTFPE